MTPRIAVPIPTSFDLEYNRQCLPQYLHALEQAGAEPVPVPLTATDAELAQVAASCDAILLPGSPADVDPARYGHPRDPATAQPDPAREHVDQLLLEDAWQNRKPILAICFGAQFLNVWRGGTLVQDLAPTPVNHSAGPSIAVAHIAAVPPATLLGSLVNRDEAELRDPHLRLPINSSHHQAIGIPGDNLIVTARSTEEGVIEAIELTTWDEPSSPFLLGVQWHPERSVNHSPTSRSLFRQFTQAAKQRVTPHP